MTIVCYVSGHGFGHAVRVTEVLRALCRRRPDTSVVLRTPIPRWMFDFDASAGCTHGFSQLDIGAIQTNSLSVDPHASLRAYADLITSKPTLIAAEIAAVSALRPRMILADIPAMACEIAVELGIPAVAMTNFSWDWIYADYVRDFPDFAWVIDDLRAGYGAATLLLRLPFYGDLSAFPRIRDIPLVARTARLAPATTRERLGLPRTDRLVLLTFGGIGTTLSCAPAVPDGVTLVSTQPPSQPGAPPKGARFISQGSMDAAGVAYEDLVAACEVVITKPGYGIVADCIANGTRLVYTPRGRFAEYPHLVNAIDAYVPNAFLSNEDLHAGRWLPALEAVLAQPSRPPAIATNGAEVAASILDEMLVH